jgi:hypothetical protein
MIIKNRFKNLKMMLNSLEISAKKNLQLYPRRSHKIYSNKDF